MLVTNPAPRFSLLLLLVAFSPFFCFSQSTDGWSFKNEKDGVKVYYRKTSDVHEIKLVTSLKTSLSGIIQLFNEVDKYPQWGYKVSEARLLQRISPTEQYYYSKLDFPWPMDDRDIVMHTQLQQDPVSRKVTATSTATPGYSPENKGVVRMRNAKTTWTLVPGAGGWLYVEYYIYSSPGGNLPDWLVNMAIDVGPRETIKNMRQLLQQPQYQSAKLAYIKD